MYRWRTRPSPMLMRTIMRSPREYGQRGGESPAQPNHRDHRLVPELREEGQPQCLEEGTPRRLLRLRFLRFRCGPEAPRAEPDEQGTGDEAHVEDRDGRRDGEADRHADRRHRGLAEERTRRNGERAVFRGERDHQELRLVSELHYRNQEERGREGGDSFHGTTDGASAVNRCARRPRSTPKSAQRCVQTR